MPRKQAEEQQPGNFPIDTPREEPQAEQPEPKPEESAEGQGKDQEGKEGKEGGESCDREKGGFDLFLEKVGPALAECCGEDGDCCDPSLCLSVLSALAPLVQGCFNKSATRLRQRKGNVMLVVTALKHSEVLKGKSRAELREIADKLFEAAQDASDEELEKFCCDCTEG